MVFHSAVETVIHNEGKPGKSVKNGNFWDTVYRQGAKNGTKITVNVNIGDQLVMFAYPASVQDCTQIKYEEINDINAKSKFTQISLQVNDASGANPVDYRVYYYIAAVPFAASATFVLTI